VCNRSTLITQLLEASSVKRKNGSKKICLCVRSAAGQNVDLRVGRTRALGTVCIERDSCLRCATLLMEGRGVEAVSKLERGDRGDVPMIVVFAIVSKQVHRLTPLPRCKQITSVALCSFPTLCCACEFLSSFKVFFLFTLERATRFSASFIEPAIFSRITFQIL